MNDGLKKIPWVPFGRVETQKQTQYHLRLQKERLPLFKENTFISIIIANFDDKNLDQTLQLLSKQSFNKFEVIVLGKAPSQKYAFPVICINTLDKQSAKNQALEKCNGNWIGFLEAGDFLSPYTFFYLAAEIEERKPDFLYTNQVLLKDGKIHRLVYKPEWSDLTLKTVNYVDRFWIIRTNLLKNARTLSEWEFLQSLNAPELKKHLVPIFCWYGENRSFAQTKATAKTLPTQKRVSVIVCFRNKTEITFRALEKLDAQKTNLETELFLVNNQSSPEEVAFLKAKISQLKIKTHWIDYSKPYNFSQMQNKVIFQHAQGDFILLLNNDTFLNQPETLAQMTAWANDSEIGTIGIRLEFPDGRLQHAGLQVSPGRFGKLFDFGNQTEDSDFAKATHEVLGSTFAACLFRREVFLKIGGLKSVKYPIGYSDLAFSLDCLKLGLKNIYLGELTAVHDEGTSRGHRYEVPENWLIEQDYLSLITPWVRRDLKTLKKKYSLADKLALYFPYLADRRFRLN